MAQRPPVGVDVPRLDLAQLADRHLRPLGQLLLGQAGFFPKLSDRPP